MVRASGRWLGVRLEAIISLLIGVVILVEVLISRDAGKWIPNQLPWKQALLIRVYCGSMAIFRACAAERFRVKSWDTIAIGSWVVGKWSKCQRGRTAVDMFGLCSIAAKQNHHLGWTHCTRGSRRRRNNQESGARGAGGLHSNNCSSPSQHHPIMLQDSCF